MTDKLLSSYMGADGEVVALCKTGCYVYKHPLSEAQSKQLLAKLANAEEINTEHWNLEWKLEKYGT